MRQRAEAATEERAETPPPIVTFIYEQKPTDGSKGSQRRTPPLSPHKRHPLPRTQITDAHAHYDKHAQQHETILLQYVHACSLPHPTACDKEKSHHTEGKFHSSSYRILRSALRIPNAGLKHCKLFPSLRGLCHRAEKKCGWGVESWGWGTFVGNEGEG